MHRSAAQGIDPGVWRWRSIHLERKQAGHCAGSSSAANQHRIQGPGMITIFLAPKGGTVALEPAARHHATLVGLAMS